MVVGRRPNRFALCGDCGLDLVFANIYIGALFDVDEIPTGFVQPPKFALCSVATDDDHRTAAAVVLLRFDGGTPLACCPRCASVLVRFLAQHQVPAIARRELTFAEAVRLLDGSHATAPAERVQVSEAP